MAVRATAADAPRPTIPPLGEGKHTPWPGAPPARRPGPARWEAPLTDLPGAPPARLRRARHRDRASVLHVDASAFPPFWRRSCLLSV